MGSTTLRYLRSISMEQEKVASADTLDSAGTMVILDDEMLKSTQTTNTGS